MLFARISPMPQIELRVFGFDLGFLTVWPLLCIQDCYPSLIGGSHFKYWHHHHYLWFLMVPVFFNGFISFITNPVYRVCLLFAMKAKSRVKENGQCKWCLVSNHWILWFLSFFLPLPIALCSCFLPKLGISVHTMFNKYLI